MDAKGEQANGGNPMGAERVSRVSRYTHEPGIDIKYGERTWRPVQSVIDLVQNHLDANTTIHEKKLLSLVGTQDYDPSNKRQQQTISLMNTIKYSQDQREIEQAFFQLRVIAGAQDISQLREQIDGIDYQRPNMRLKVTNGQTTQFVQYDDVKGLPEEWQVVGFRVEDAGSGFDDRLLGMMGASTKKESTGKRGGLGEGLKMSVTHLARAGADVRLLSRNQDSLWIARPKVRDGRITFDGIKREGTGDITGSLTDVDFSKATLDEKSRGDIVAALDPRKGEGLGKYVLEFRGDDFIPLVSSSNEIASHGVPAGRIYVKGLLVQEDANLLFSYNLGEKWAIQGRDRKTVQQDVLIGDVRKAIGSITEAEKLKPVVTAIAQKGSQLELEVVDPELQLGELQAQAWRETLKEVFDFEAGKTLFAPNYLSSDQQRLLREQGFTIVLIPPERNKAIALFEKLYEGQIVSSKQFFEQRGAQGTASHGTSTKGIDALISSIPIEEQDTPVSPEAAARLDELKADFMIMLLENAIAHNQGLKFEDLRELKFAVARNPNTEPNASPFEYNRARNTIYVGGVDLSSFQAQVDLYAEMIKTAVGREVFDTATQQILSQLAAKAVVKLRPELLEQYTPIHLNGNTEFQKPVTYTDVERDQDAVLTDFLSNVRVVNSPDASLDEVQAALAKMREYSARKDEPRFAQVKEVVSRGLSHELNDVFYFKGRLYSVNSFGFGINEFKIKGSAEDTPEPTPTKPPTKKFSLEDMDWMRSTIFGGTSEKAPEITSRSYDISSSSGSYRRKMGESESKMPPRELLQAGEDHYTLEANVGYYLPYQLQDGESIRLLFSDGEKEAYVLIRRRGDKIFTKRGNEETTDFIPRGKRASLMYKNSFQNTFTVYNNVINITPSENFEISIERNNLNTTGQLPEDNQGKEFIDTKITIDYGGEVWRDPKRILLDAIQNHVDAQNGESPNLTFTITDTDGRIRSVSQDELIEMGDEWRVVGVSIQDQGEGYTTPYLSSLGASTKGDEDIGKFGEGLKMLAASAVRQGIQVEFSSRDWNAKPTSYQTTVKDYETGKDRVFTMLGYQMRWADSNQVGASTKFSVLPSTFEAEQQALTEAQLSELQALLDPSSSLGHIWQNWMLVIDPRNTNDYGQRGLDRFIAPKDEEEHTDGIVRVISSQPGRIFEKGLFIPSQTTTQPMMFGYDIDESIIDTRERNAYNQELLDEYLKEYYRNLTDKDLIKRVVETIRANPEASFYEYKFLGSSYDISPKTKVLWRQAFYEVYGDDAVLSLAPYYQRMARNGADSKYLGPVAKAVANEVHLENANLVTLPENLTLFYHELVYDSQDFLKDFESADVQLSPTDQQQLTALVQGVNSLLAEIIDSDEADPAKISVLRKFVTLQALHGRKDRMLRMTQDSVIVKSKAFPAAGMVEAKNGHAVTYLNQNVLNDPEELVDTYTHEQAHFISGQKDYTLDFQRFLMLIALHGQN